jgi:hypothetical protein
MLDMTVRPTVRIPDMTLPARWQRRRRVVIPVIAALLAVGAFLFWGPIGLGNGPLGVPAGFGDFGQVQASTQPTAYVATLVNAGGSTAVIDNVTVTSAQGYSPVRVLSVRVARHSMYGCVDNGPASNLAACARPPFAPAAGFAVGPHVNSVVGSRNGPALVIEMARPSATQCVVLTAIVVRYHVGIRHYTATVPQGDAWACGKVARHPQGL